MVLRATFKNERGVCDVLISEQDVDVNVLVAGIHPVADQKGAILTIQDLEPDPGCPPGGYNFNLKGFLTRGCCEAVVERMWNKQ